MRAFTRGGLPGGIFLDSAPINRRLYPCATPHRVIPQNITKREHRSALRAARKARVRELKARRP